MVVGEGAVHLAEDHAMMPGQPLDDHVEDRPGGAVARVPADAERLAGKALEQPVGVSGADVDFLDAAVALVPVARCGALAELLDLRAEQRAALQQQLEPVIVGRVVAAGNLDAAVDVHLAGREIEHRRGAHSDHHDVEPACREPAHQSGFEHPRVSPPVAPDRHPPRALAARLGRIGPAERIGVGFGQRVADDPANVIFAQDGGVEDVRHRAAPVIASEAKQSRRKGSHTKTRRKNKTRRIAGLFVASLLLRVFV